MKPFPYLLWAQHWTPYQEFSPLLELETINSPKLLLDSGRIQVLGVGGVWYRPAHLMTEMYSTKREPEDLNTKGSVHTKGPHRVQICYKSTCCVERQVLKCWHRMELEGCLGLELLFPQQLLCVCMFSNMWSFFRGYRKFEYQNVFKVHPPSPSKFTPFCSGGLVRPRTFCILLLGRFLFRVQIWVIIEFRSSQLRPSQMWEHKQIREPNTPCVPFDVFLFKFYHGKGAKNFRTWSWSRASSWVWKNVSPSDFLHVHLLQVSFSTAGPLRRRKYSPFPEDETRNGHQNTKRNPVWWKLKSLFKWAVWKKICYHHRGFCFVFQCPFRDPSSRERAVTLYYFDNCTHWNASS